MTALRHEIFSVCCFLIFQPTVLLVNYGIPSVFQHLTVLPSVPDAFPCFRFLIAGVMKTIIFHNNVDFMVGSSIKNYV